MRQKSTSETQGGNRGEATELWPGQQQALAGPAGTQLSLTLPHARGARLFEPQGTGLESSPFFL